MSESIEGLVQKQLSPQGSIQGLEVRSSQVAPEVEHSYDGGERPGHGKPGYSDFVGFRIQVVGVRGIL